MTGGKECKSQAKAAGIHGITQEMLKYGGEAAIEWMVLLCD